MKPIIPLFFFAATCYASVIDTSAVYQSGGVSFSFNLDGQAFTPDGIPVTGVTFGFDPLPPCDWCYAQPQAPPPPIDQPPSPIDLPLPSPTSDTPEPASTFGMAAALLCAGLLKRRTAR